MTGATTTDISVIDHLNRLYKGYLSTYGRPPRGFILGPEELCQFSKENHERCKFTGEDEHNHAFLDSEIIPGGDKGILIVNH